MLHNIGLAVSAAVLVLVGCGGGPEDWRDNFLGTYQYDSFGTVTFNGQTSQLPSNSGTQRVFAGTNDDEIVFEDDTCATTATVISSTRFSLHAAECRSYDADGCLYIDRIQSGTGTLEGRDITMDSSGTVSIDCPDGSSESGTFSAHFTGTKL
jgi:hypothetical protein